MLDLILTNQAARLATLFGIFIVVVGIALIAINIANRRSQIRAGLQQIATSGRQNDDQQTAASLRHRELQNAWAKLADMIERTGLDLTDTKNERLRDKLISAGYTHPAAPRIYTMARIAIMAILPIGFVLFSYGYSEEPPGFLTLYAGCSLMGVLGLYLPNLFVQAKADRRKEEIVNGFPDCLDLLLVCVEAGLGIEAAMDRVGREMVKSHPLVAQLLSIAVLRLRAGASREEAFRRLADMARVDEIRSFTTLLIQSDKLGTSMSSTLRVYADEMREKRRMRAEEKAHRLPVLISIPLVVCMLPTMIGVLMLPASIRVVRDIFPLMNR
ncbi:type II secretion system F family protein [Croceicoccus ponticola]|uniref:Type II secretion system F family protein n=1 Tax=Croceicoccus ponticola TaxID=2217664 RepID=A0A437H192_9SPHN|nr:type II secretion system F family protein [Croceicoccus ponticola]RVQ69388.1 type II secretion system F family protein [Croceicoccus ponticola]